MYILLKNGGGGIKNMWEVKKINKIKSTENIFPFFPLPWVKTRWGGGGDSLMSFPL